jgi:hypothetical protein
MKPRTAKNRVHFLLAGVLLAACAGCQTFSLSEDQFEQQQYGKVVDRTTGDVVSVVGSIGYLGAMIGEAVAASRR